MTIAIHLNSPKDQGHFGTKSGIVVGGLNHIMQVQGSQNAYSMGRNKTK